MKVRNLYKFPDGRDWLWGKLSLALMGRTPLSKTLINCLLMGGAILPPCYLFSLKQPNRGDYRLNSLPNGRVHGYLQRRLMPRYISQNCCCQCPCPWGRQLSTHGSTGDPQTQVGLAQSPVGHFSFPLASGTQKVLFVPSKSLFPLVLWIFCNQIPMPIKVRFPGNSRWVI